jgi:hypothetical protein
VEAQAGAPIDETAISVSMDGAPADCDPTTPETHAQVFRCRVPAGLSALVIASGPTTAAFQLYVTFTEAVCTQETEVCGL